MKVKPLPIGIDNFEKIIREGYYYIDKTWFIKELWDKKSEVNLFTRPRRFGKSLNMSMIQYFFEDTGEEEKNQERRNLFSGLEIMQAGDDVTGQMGRYPVISLSLKSAKQPTFEMARDSLIDEIIKEFNRHDYVRQGGRLIANEKELFEAIQNRRAEDIQYAKALEILSRCLMRHHGRPAVILIDEYDVPLENAYYEGFYDEMTGFIRSLFESSLKSNPSMAFSVVTGCLRISRESIFTGLNNLNVVSIVSNQYDEYFGFSQQEIDGLLEYYGKKEECDRIRDWYDGYQFGEAKVYNPWSVICFIAEAISGKETFPRPYWSNTSSNQIVKDLVMRANPAVKQEIEILIEGGCIEKPVHEDITYDSIYDSENNLWNFLFFTGYLKMVSRRMDEENLYVGLMIPNQEVKYVYRNTILQWFREEIKVQDLTVLYQAALSGNQEIFQQELTRLLQKSISYTDNKEAFYHGFLMGVFGNLKDYIVNSNREAGDGRYDICIRSLDVRTAPLIFELKVSETFKGMDEACDRALKQIEEKRYDGWLPEEGYTKVYHYGIAFFKKQCRIKVRKRNL